MCVQKIRCQMRRELAFFERADEILAGIGKSDKPVARKRRACRHAQRWQNAGIGFDHIRCNRGQVFGEGEALLDALDGFLAGIPVRLRRKLHEPLIELVN